MSIGNLFRRLRTRREVNSKMVHYCDHGASSEVICPDCVDEFVANFHLSEVSGCESASPEVSTPQVGRKDDTGKAPVVRGVIQYFPNALEAVANVSAFGAKKYDWGNWQFVPDGLERYTDALGRHLASEGRESHDSESGLLHAAHGAWNALARLEFLLTQKKD